MSPVHKFSCRISTHWSKAGCGHILKRCKAHRLALLIHHRWCRSLFLSMNYWAWWSIDSDIACLHPVFVFGCWNGCRSQRIRLEGCTCQVWYQRPLFHTFPAFWLYLHQGGPFSLAQSLLENGWSSNNHSNCHKYMVYNFNCSTKLSSRESQFAGKYLFRTRLAKASLHT